MGVGLGLGLGLGLGMAIVLALHEYCMVCTSNSNLNRWICESEPA